MGQPDAASSQRHRFWNEVAFQSLGLTLLFEAFTVLARLWMGSAVEFNRSAPLWLQIHHMFWSIPIFVAAVATRRWPRAARFLTSCGTALIASDLLHHFVVLPLTVGNTGWHWP